MKNIDIKSLIIGALLTSTIFLGVAATNTTAGEEQWTYFMTGGYPSEVLRATSQSLYDRELAKYKEAMTGQPFAVQGKNIITRKRIK